MPSPRALWNTLFSFGAIQVALIFLPLLAFPYLARVLQPEAFGQIMYLLTVSMVIGIVVEWGFSLGAVRDVALRRENPEALHHVVYNVLSAKLLLALLCIAGSAAFRGLFPSWGGPGIGWAYAVGYGIIQGFNPTWYHQGMGQGMRGVAVYDVGSSALALALMFIVVRHPADSTLYLLLLLLCKGVCYAWLNVRLCRRYTPCLFSLHRAWHALLQARVFFFARMASMLYTQGNILLLGNIVPTRALGMLIASDKIARAVVSVSSPITQTLFPEVCALHRAAPHTTRRYLRLSLTASAIVGTLAAVALWWAAPWVIAIALGAHYTEAIPILRIVCCVIPFLACNFVLGTQILVPFGQEQALVRVLFMVGLASLPTVALLGFWGGITGAAFMPLMVEGTIFCLLMLRVYKTCPEALLSSSALP